MIQLELRHAYELYPDGEVSEADYHIILVNGVEVCNEYSISDQFITLQETLKVLGLEFKAFCSDWIWDDNTCDWIRPLGAKNEEGNTST